MSNNQEKIQCRDEKTRQKGELCPTIKVHLGSRWGRLQTRLWISSSTNIWCQVPLPLFVSMFFVSSRYVLQRPTITKFYDATSTYLCKDTVFRTFKRGAYVCPIILSALFQCAPPTCVLYINFRIVGRPYPRLPHLAICVSCVLATRNNMAMTDAVSLLVKYILPSVFFSFHTFLWNVGPQLHSINDIGRPHNNWPFVFTTQCFFPKFSSILLSIFKRFESVLAVTPWTLQYVTVQFKREPPAVMAGDY